MICFCCYYCTCCCSVFGTLLDVVISEDDSVSHVCSRMFQSQMTTLENCLQLYTQQELVSGVVMGYITLTLGVVE